MGPGGAVQLIYRQPGTHTAQQHLYGPPFVRGGDHLHGLGYTAQVNPVSPAESSEPFATPAGRRLPFRGPQLLPDLSQLLAGLRYAYPGFWLLGRGLGDAPLSTGPGVEAARQRAPRPFPPP